jgi:D-amino peptidase
MTNEVNAAIRGAVSEGVKEIVVCDAHWKMTNIDPNNLHPQAYLIQGDPAPLSMMQGLDESFNAVFLTGYHAMAGTQGAAIDHSYAPHTIIQNVRFNGERVDESVINGFLAAYYRIPVVLLTGDDKICAEVGSSFPGIVTVAVKEGITRCCSKSLHPSQAWGKIEAGAREAIKKIPVIKPPELPDKIRIEVDFTDTAFADLSELIPTTYRTAPRSIAFDSYDYLVGFKTLQAVLRICDSV